MEPEPVPRLPNAWGLLAQYCQMDPEELERGITQGEITTDDVVPTLREKLEVETFARQLAAIQHAAQVCTQHLDAIQGSARRLEHAFSTLLDTRPRRGKHGE